MQKALFVVAVVAGLLIAYVDSRPTWDDTGITVAGLVLTAAIVGFFVQRQPWFFGLAIGIWIPIVPIYKTGDFKLLVVLLFPMIGVYAGWAVRKAVRRSSHSV